MSLFPKQVSPIYDSKDRDVVDILEKFYNDTITINQTFWEQADIDTRFEAGDQEVFYNLYSDIPDAKLTNFNFNHIRRIVNMISGHQRRNRKSIVVIPVENGDEETADQYTKIMMWLNSQESILDTVSQAFHGAIVTGMSLLQTWVDYRQDPISGNIRVDYCPYNSFLIDPHWKKRDLSDCNVVWKRSYLSKKAAISLIPKKRDIIEQMDGGSRDDKFIFLPEHNNTNLKNLLAYDEYYYRDYRKQKMLIDAESGEVTEWQYESDKGLNKFLAMYPQISLVEQEVPTTKLITLLQGKVMYDGPNPMGIDRFPFVPVLGYYHPEISDYSLRIQGLVRGIRDAQFLYNRRKRIELDLLESQLNSGWKYKVGALKDPKSIYLTGQGKGIAINKTAAMTDVEQIITQGVPQSYFQVSEGLVREMPQIVGANEELLGTGSDDKPGALSMMLRMGGSLTTLQPLFDQLDNSQKLLGKILLETVQANFSPAKVKKIIEQDPAPQFYKKAFGRYDAICEEGLNTVTQRQMQFSDLLKLKEMGIAIPDSTIIDSMVVRNKKQLKEAIDQINQQKQQQDQVELQGNLQEQQARKELTEARALADRGLGAERISRIKENQALAEERKSEALKDETMSALNIAKAIKELDDIDIEQIQKTLLVISSLKGKQEVTNERK